MILLIDIGNTRVHVGLGDARAVRRVLEFPTRELGSAGARRRFRDWLGTAELEGAAMASVVPGATDAALELVARHWRGPVRRLLPTGPCGIPMRYPGRGTLGQDRLANAIAARRHVGAPCVVVGCGTATTFDVVAPDGAYVGGAISPGLSMLADALHEKTAQLPRVEVCAVRRAIGRNTQEALLAGTALGYRGLIESILRGIRKELGVKELPVVATGGNARWVVKNVRGVTMARPHLTLEGLRLFWRGQEAV